MRIRSVVWILGAILALALSASAQAPDVQRTRARTGVAREQFEATVLARTNPEYPAMARTAGISGIVVVEVVVDEHGAIAEVQATSGPPLLRAAAVGAANAWTFMPAKKNGKAVKSDGAILFEFAIEPDYGEDDEQANDVPDDPAGAAGSGGVEVDPNKPPEDPLAEEIENARANPTSPDAHVLLANLYFSTGRTDEAITEYEAALALQPDNEKAVVGLGQVMQTGGRMDDAIVLYRKALESMPDSTVVLDRLGSVLMQQKRFGEAVPVFERLAGLAPDSPGVFFGLSIALEKNNRLEDAVNALKRATTINPDFAMAYHRQGSIYARLRRFDDAIAAYTRILAMPQRYQMINMVHRELSAVYISTGRYAEAIEILEKVIEETPDFLDAYCQLGEAYLILDRLDDSEKILRRALRIDRDSRCTLEFWATLQIRLKNLGEAESTLNRKLELYGDNALTRAHLAYVLSEQRRYDEALTEIRRVIAADPNTGTWYDLLGEILKVAGNVSEAETAYRKALELEPANVAVMNDLGYFLADQGIKLEEAVTLLRRAVDAEPRNGILLDSLGWALFKSGNLDEADKYLAAAAEARPQIPEIQEHLGDLAERRGQIEKARALWQKALTMSLATTDQVARLKKKLEPKAGAR